MTKKYLLIIIMSLAAVLILGSCTRVSLPGTRSHSNANQSWRIGCLTNEWDGFHPDDRDSNRNGPGTAFWYRNEYRTGSPRDFHALWYASKPQFANIGSTDRWGTDSDNSYYSDTWRDTHHHCAIFYTGTPFDLHANAGRISVVYCSSI